MSETQPTTGQRLGVAILKSTAWLPLPLSHGLGVLLGWLIRIIPSRTKNIAIKNIQLCYPELNAADQTRLLAQSLTEAAKATTEICALWSWPEPRIRGLVRSVSGAEIIDEARQANRGVIALVPHLGSWEMINIFLSLNYPLCSLYRPPRNPSLAPLIKGRERFGAKLVPTNTRGVRALFQSLKENQVVMILPDQDPARGSGVFAPFFGIQTHTPVLLNRIAERSGAEIVTLFAERLPAGRGYHIHIQKPETPIRGETAEQAAVVLNQEIERCVRQLPGQYQWTYKRFKTRPPEEGGNFWQLNPPS